MNADDRRRLLGIYLGDHWAGAGAGTNVARRLYRNNRKSRWADQLEWLREEVESDERTLARLRTRLGVDGGTLKRRLALAGERAGRLKMNGRIVTYSPLSRLIEAEALMAGISAKRRLWSAMRHGGPPGGDELDDFDFSELERRADEQLDIISSFHRDAAALAFGPRGRA